MPSANVTEALDGLTTALTTTMTLMTFVLIPVALTVVMFLSRNSLLGFPAALFWAIVGGYAYSQSTAVWDFYYLLAFGSLLGMVTFTAFGAYALREKRDAFGDESVELGDGPTVDEGKKGTIFQDKDVVNESKRAQKLHARADSRRSSPPMGEDD